MQKVKLVQGRRSIDGREPGVSFDSESEASLRQNPRKKKASVCCLKRLVSRNKVRFRNENFDLDLAYITKRVIAMGFPATGLESFYRNARSTIVRFFDVYHSR